MVKNLPAMWETWVRSLGGEDPLVKEMATHSCILAWRIPWIEEPGGLYSLWDRQESDMTERLTLQHSRDYLKHFIMLDFFLKLFSWFLEKQFFTSILRNLTSGIWRSMKTAQTLYLVVVFNESFINESFTIIGIFSCKSWNSLLLYKTGRAVTCAIGGYYHYLTSWKWGSYFFLWWTV